MATVPNTLLLLEHGGFLSGTRSDISGIIETPLGAFVTGTGLSVAALVSCPVAQRPIRFPHVTAAQLAAALHYWHDRQQMYIGQPASEPAGQS